jgi:hypothetical protein
MPLHGSNHADLLPLPIANILKNGVVGRIDHRCIC